MIDTDHAAATGKHLDLRRAINALTLIGVEPGAVRTLHDAADALAAERDALRAQVERLQRAALKAARTPYTDRDEDSDAFADADVAEWLYADGVVQPDDLGVAAIMADD